MTVVVVLQPSYLPWLGFFDQMRRSDVFVYYDDVQFDKHGWRNRNRLKSRAGPVWVTVPVLHGGLGPQRIDEIEIDNGRPWARKQIETIRQLYARAPHGGACLPELEDLLCGRAWERLVDLNLAVTALLAGWLGIRCRIARSSELGVAGGKSERLLAICQRFGADRYLSGDSAKDYLDVDLFTAGGVAVEWQNFQHPSYLQQHGDFVPYLSALDFILNVGPTRPV